MEGTVNIFILAVAGLPLADEVAALDELAVGGELGGGFLSAHGAARVVLRVGIWELLLDDWQRDGVA